jgi:hypothetical protein
LSSSWWQVNVDGKRKSDEKAKKKQINGLMVERFFCSQHRRLKSSCAANHPMLQRLYLMWYNFFQFYSNKQLILKHINYSSYHKEMMKDD